MKLKHIIKLLAILFITVSCKNKSDLQTNKEDAWKLGWRVIASSMHENYRLASLQFDSLRILADTIDIKYLVAGLEAKSKAGKDDEISEILSTRDQSTLAEVCTRKFLASYVECQNHIVEEVANPELQQEIITMYVNDQAVRGNLMEDVINHFNIDSATIIKSGGVEVDKRNRAKLKEIIANHGFPTSKLVGKSAVHGMFLIIQHSDGDKEWQKSQLSYIEAAVRNGDLDGQSYAYLYDRIKINSGQKQLYGTQFSNVDPINRIVELAPTEDIENLDRRRMEIGMMPILMYKNFMLENL